MSAFRQTDGIADASRTARIDGIIFDEHWGWLHLPEDRARIRGSVLLCAPLGREARNAHRSLWLFAQQLAAAGFAVLRYDHCHTGESLPLPDERDHWTAWLKGVEQAAAALTRWVDASALVLGGLRIGASLATLAAERLKPDALILFAPVLKGRTWVREMQIETGLRSGRGAAEIDRGLDADGLWLGRESLQSLMTFDLTRVQHAPKQVFLGSRNSSDGQLLSRLKVLGAEVCSTPFDGYEDLFKDAYRNAHPHSVFAAAQDWLQDLCGGWPRGRACRPSEPATLAMPHGTERAVAFGQGLRGVLTVPSLRNPKRKAVIFINTGGDPRAGIGSFTVEACRELCRRGIGSLRFDLAGFGDSDFAAAWRSHVYETPRAGEFDAAIELLAAEDFTHLTIAGLCSGGYHAIDVAGRDARIAGAYSINAAVLAWRRGDPLDPPENSEGWNQPWLRDIGRRLLSPAKWRRVLQGDISPRAVVLNVWKRLERRVLQRLDRNQTYALRQKIRRISSRGGNVRLLMGAADCSLDEFETHFGRNGRWLANMPGISIGVVDGLDHGLFFRESRRLALKDILTFVDIGPTTLTPSPQADFAVGVEVSAPT